MYSLAPLNSLDKNARAGVFIVYTSEDDPSADLSVPVTLDEFRASARRVLGGDLPMTDPQLLTRLVGNSRLADRYRAGRILLAGDAAHIFGAGGSLNAGLLDAVNLGWKLAAQAQGRAPDGLLDSYDAERHVVGQRAILQTRAQKALSAIGKDGPGQGGPVKAGGEGAEAVRELFGDVLERPEPLRHVGELLRQPDLLRKIGELIEGFRRPLPDAVRAAAGHGSRTHRTHRIRCSGGWCRTSGCEPAKPVAPAPVSPSSCERPGACCWTSPPAGGRRGGRGLGSPGERCHRPQPGSARPGRRAADQARRLRRLGRGIRHARPGCRAGRGPAHLVQPAQRAVSSEQ